MRQGVCEPGSGNLGVFGQCRVDLGKWQPDVMAQAAEAGDDIETVGGARQGQVQGGHGAQEQGEVETGGIGAMTGEGGNGEGFREGLDGFVGDKIVGQLGGAGTGRAGRQFGMIDAAFGGTQEFRGRHGRPPGK